MTQDPWTVLGVPRGATSDEIRAAYRRLASKHHPDRGGDTAKFQEIQSAYESIRDGKNYQKAEGPSFDFTGFGDFFDRIRKQEKITTVTLTIPLEDSVRGVRRQVKIPGLESIVELAIPAGISDGETLIYSNLFPDGRVLRVTFRVAQHPMVRREHLHLHQTVPVSVWDLILGTKLAFKDIQDRDISITIPAMTQPSTVFRCQRQGVTKTDARVGTITGDLFVHLRCDIPAHIPQPLLEEIQKMKSSQEPT